MRGPFNNPIPRTGSPHFREASGQRSPRDSDALGRAHLKHEQHTFNGVALGHAVRQIQSQLQRLRMRGSGGQSGISGFHKPSNGKYEADPTVFYDAQTWVYISPTSSLVVTGIRDASNPSGPLIKSCAGWWLALQDVNPKTVVSGNDVWNLPQSPLPSVTAPIMDQPLNFWEYMGKTNC